MSDWATTTEERIQRSDLIEEFQLSYEYLDAFTDWDSKTHPEEYEND